MIWMKKAGGHLLLYGSVIGIFILVLYLYGALSEAVMREAVLYAAGLSSCLLLLVFIICLFWHAGRGRRAGQVLAALPNEVGEFPSPETELEWRYQEKLGELSKLVKEMDGAAHIGRREMMDYYGLWAHQIKTPLAAMQVLVQSLEETLLAESGAEEGGTLSNGGEALPAGSEAAEAGDGDGTSAVNESERLLREMKTELFKTEQYVGMVLSYLRAEEMGHDLLLKEYPLDVIIRRAVKKYSFLFISKRIRLDYRESKSTVVTDEKWLLFVLEQLLSNALKYTPQGGKITIYRETGERRRLVIKDDGIGIQAEDLPRIFEKGFTGFNGRQDKKSTGIGLYLCRMVCDKLGCDLAVESGEGVGTCVYLGMEPA